MSATTADILQCAEDTATFRAWAASTRALMLAAGWLKSADSGQINLTTATMPASYFVAGYDIFRLADALQATAPVFCRLEYGIGSAGRPAIRATFGTGSDGAGTIVHPSPSALAYPTATAASGETRPAYACAHDGLAATAQISAGGGPATLIAVERWRDGDGEPNGLGWSYVTVVGNALRESTYRVASAGWRAERSSLTCLVPSGVTSASEGADVGVFPYVPIHGTAKSPAVSLASYFDADISARSPIAVNRYGDARTYITLGNPNGNWGGAINTMAGAMIFD